MTPRSSSRRRAACVLAAWAALGGALIGASGAPSAQPGPLADSSAWHRLGDYPVRAEAYAFVGDPDDPTPWIGYRGILALDPATNTWIEIVPGITPDGFLFVGPDPLAPDTVFADAPLQRSVDGGKTYTLIEDPAADNGGGQSSSLTIGDYHTLVRIPPGAPHAGRLVSGDWPTFVYSDDGGDSWARSAESPTLQITFSMLALDSGRLIAVGFWGALASDDGGESFEAIDGFYAGNRVSHDLHNLTVLDGVVTGRPGDSAQGRIVMTGVGAGVGHSLWASDDDGRTWARHPMPGETACGNGVDVVPLDTAVGGEVGWAAAVHCDGRVLVSTDGAETWLEIGRVPGSYATGGLARVESATLGPDGRLYAAMGRAGHLSPWQYRSAGRLVEAMRVAVAAEEEGPAQSSSLRVSPNPARGAVTLSLSEAARPSVEVVVVDSVGREVARRSVDRAWRLDVAGWAPGLYHARVEGAEAVAFTVVR